MATAEFSKFAGIFKCLKFVKLARITLLLIFILPESWLRPPGILMEKRKEGGNIASCYEKETFHADDKRCNFMVWLYGIFLLAKLDFW